MPHTTARLARSVHRFALGVAMFVALGIPLGYWFMAYHDRSEALDFKAKVKASALSTLIASSPEVWMFAKNRLQGLISREPVPLGNEQVQVLDKDGTIVIAVGQAPDAPVLKRAYALYDSGHSVGQITVSDSLTPQILHTLLIALLSFLLGAVVYFGMKLLPLRALQIAIEAQQGAETTLRSIGDGVVTTDKDGYVTYLNPVAEVLLGEWNHKVRGRHVKDVLQLHDADNGEIVESSLYRALMSNGIASCKGTCEIRHANGKKVAIEERAAPIIGSDGAVSGGVVVLRDVSVTREYLRRRSWEATHDPLTSLLNRREFEKRVKLALSDAQATGRAHVVCFMDLDDFKIVNDSAGHQAGDELLIRLSKLMQTRIRDTDTLARVGGDEFGLLIEGCDENRGQVIAQDILTAVGDLQFDHDGKTFKVGISVGLTVINHDHTHIAEILGEADCACYLAKERGKSRIIVFVASDMNLAARRSEPSWVMRINETFRENRFVLYHQMYRTLNPAAGYIDHLEVLLRMIDEDGEVISPERFLPAAVRFNLMPAIDRWVIHEVFSRHATLIAERGGKPLICAVNLSGASINSEGFLDFIQAEALRYELNPSAICFELTETVAVNSLQAAAKFIAECKELGFEFALDDFGTGTSSFGYLKNLPVDYLKIDGSFVKNIEHDDIDEAMVETINHIGHLLGKRTIAEYAENEVIIAKLVSIGVDFAQGYGVCRPKPLFI